MRRIAEALKNRMLIRHPKTGKAVSFRKPNLFTLIPFILLGIGSLIWFLIRVIPKPSRAIYPCMKVAMPLAFSFIAYLVSLTASILLFRKALAHFRTSRYKYAVLFVSLGLFFGLGTMIHQALPSSAGAITQAAIAEDPLGPNAPIGIPKGVQPGRVVWVHNPNATNKNCTNANQSDAYWLAKNCDQTVVDNMFSEGILSLTGKATHAEAWDAIFRYFNLSHGKGDTGYIIGETIFIKINAVTAWSGAPLSGEMPKETKYIEYDTSPQAIMALLRQLVNEAGVPQENIYIGDPMADIWNHLYNYFHAEFPDIKYTSKRNVTGRYKLTASTEKGITYSDKGSVMETDTKTNYYFKEMMEADYLLNIPTMKGHRWAGTTFFAKNHFGSNTSDGSWRLHPGLMQNSESEPVRTGYKQYRVLVDLMGCRYLGGNTLMYFMEALWSTSYEHQRPQKFLTAPFNNDWCSSLFFSMDPVAIESVCLDILKKEFTEEEIIDGTGKTGIDRFTFVQWEGVDDYLHQAASSEWWPEGITYDPNNTGAGIESLGVHEHWNNKDDMQYSRNLGTGEGIELVRIYHEPSGLSQTVSAPTLEVFPNPVSTSATFRIHTDHPQEVKLSIYSLGGKLITTLIDEQLQTGDYDIIWNPGNLKGIYLGKLIMTDGISSKEQSIKLQVL